MEEKERALLVGVNINDDEYFFKEVNELRELAKACNMEPVELVVQNLSSINSAFYVGVGKLDEIKDKIKELDIDIVIFNNELTPSQLKNIEQKLDIAVLDKTALILEIFNIRAKTKEAKLQVEVARLKYMLPRLVGLHKALGRQGGGSGVSNKGSGEKKIELDRRIIEARISKLNKELEQISKTRETQSKQREKSSIPLVSMVGYTNAGKSTLLNDFVELSGEDEGKKVFEEDMLFATLETSVRKIKLKDNKEFLLSDTVGFIKSLPHELIKAFRSTLEEVKHADLLLHVIDFSDDDYEENIRVTENTLKIIGAQDIPVIYVYNKSELKKEKLPIVSDNSIYISAKNKIGIYELLDLINKTIYKGYKTCCMLIPYDKGSILSYFNEIYNIKRTEYLEEGTKIEFDCSLKDYDKYKEYLIEE